MGRKNTTVFERQGPSVAEVEASLAETRSAVFWLDDVRERRVSHPPLTENVVADLLVIGGGYAGLWTALRALERNPERNVVVLESAEIGHAASGRNGGFCEASLTHGEANGALRWPHEMDQLTRMGVENLDGIEETILRYGIDCDFERNGILSVAVEPHQIEWISEESPSEHSSGFLDHDAVQREVSSPAFLGGVWEKGACATLHPAKLALELARVIVQLGARVYEHSEALKLVDAGSAVTVTTASGSVYADQVVLATNAYSPLLRRNRLMVVPVYDYVLATEPLSEGQLAAIGWQHRQGLSDMANRFHYFRLTADNRIVFGGGSAKYHPGRKVKDEYENNPTAYRQVAQDFLTYFPQLAGIRFRLRPVGWCNS